MTKRKHKIASKPYLRDIEGIRYLYDVYGYIVRGVSLKDPFMLSVADYNLFEAAKPYGTFEEKSHEQLRV